MRIFGNRIKQYGDFLVNGFSGEIRHTLLPLFGSNYLHTPSMQLKKPGHAGTSIVSRAYTL